MSNIPIVQGVTVPSHSPAYDSTSGYDQYNDPYQNASVPLAGATKVSSAGSGDDFQYATPQELRERRQHPVHQFQDVFWALLFWLQLFVMVGLMILNLTSSSSWDAQGGGGANNASTMGNIIFLVVVLALCGLGLSALALSFMMQHTETLVQMALVFSVVSSLVVGMVGFMLGSLLMGCLGLLSFALGICYARAVWPRIPFAAANLTTALTAVRQNLGLTLVAVALTLLAGAWSTLWMLGVGQSLSGQNYALVFVYFLSYYWVHQVLQNTMHVTTAGVIGTWWFVPEEANSFCSKALGDSLFRSTTYSFGSICFGSLLVAIVQALRALEYYIRDNDEFSFLLCLVQCVLGCIEAIIEYVNKWAYVYVGLYGFGYIEAGRNVIQLFEAKGWTAIITDDLADNVLFMMAMAVALATGLVGMILGSLDPNMLQDLGMGHASLPAFVMGFLTGYLMAAIIFAIVASAVSTVIVCYAEDPAAFQMNYPQLSTAMRAAWVQAWPGMVQ